MINISSDKQDVALLPPMGSVNLGTSCANLAPGSSYVVFPYSLATPGSMPWIQTTTIGAVCGNRDAWSRRPGGIHHHLRRLERI